MLSIKTILLVTEKEQRRHPSVQKCQNISEDRGCERGGKMKRKKGSDRKQRDRERVKERQKEGEKDMEITTKKGSSADCPLGHSSSPEKPPSTPTPHSSFSLLPAPTTLHWFALQCGRQATTCESNYSYRERLGERQGGRDRGAGNHAFRLCLCEKRK